MEKIAFIFKNRFVYWKPMILFMAVLSAICAFSALAVRKKEDCRQAVFAIPGAILLSLLFARLLHWYCRPHGYESLFTALTDYSRGGVAVPGIFIGCILSAVLLRQLKICRNLPGLLDQMAAAGALGIGTGRVSALVTAENRGMLLPRWVPFPFASRIPSPATGETEVRLAVFMIQAMIAWALFVGLMIFYFRQEKRKDGDVFLLFMLLYCGSQFILDSTRYDALTLRSNGFISLTQILSGLVLAGVLAVCTIRLLKSGGRKFCFLSIPALSYLAMAGYMEYYVQRHGRNAPQAYTVMTLSILFAEFLILEIRREAERKQKPEDIF